MGHDTKLDELQSILEALIIASGLLLIGAHVTYLACHEVLEHYCIRLIPYIVDGDDAIIFV